MTRKGLAFLLVGLLLGAFLGSAVLLNTSASGNGPKVGKPLENFQLKRLDGSIVKLSDLKGKAVIINFWATWCVPCQDEMPLLDKTAQKYSDRLVVLGIDSQEQPVDVGNFINKLGIKFPIALDSDGSLSQKFLVNGFPTSFFVDKEGILRNLHIGVLREELLAGYLSSIEVTP